MESLRIRIGKSAKVELLRPWRFLSCSEPFENEIYKYLTTFEFVFIFSVAYEKEIDMYLYFFQYNP